MEADRNARCPARKGGSCYFQWRNKLSDVRFLLLLVAVVIELSIEPCRATGIFPVQTAIATGRPVVLNASCASQVFCSHSSPLWQSTAPGTCIQRQCNASCPHGSSIPAAIELSLLQPGFDTFASAFVFQDVYVLSLGYLRLRSQHAPRLDAANGFTVQINLVSFLGDAEVFLFEKVSAATDMTFFRVRLAFRQNRLSGSISVDYMVNSTHSMTATMTNVQNLQTVVKASPTDFTMSVLGRQVLVFFAGTLQAATMLNAVVQDDTGDFYIGGRTSPGSSFVMSRTVKFYSSAVSERVAMILSGKTPPTYQPSSQCHCPATHPQVSTSNSSICANSFLTSAGSVLRINAEVFVPSNINDGRLSTAAVTALGQNVVQFTIDLQGSFEVFYSGISFWNPRAGAAVLQLSADGVTYKDMQYFAENCTASFASQPIAQRANASQVNCKSSGIPAQHIWEYYLDRETGSQPLLDSGEYLANIAPFATGRYARILLTQFGATQSSSSRDQYYGVTEFDIRGRCSCSGHADTCVQSPADNLYRCQCQYNTEGDSCERCQSLYNDKPWRAGNSTSPNACAQCNCHQHALTCTYNATLDTHPHSRVLGGGGVCDCQDNTAGRNCDQCGRGYYRDVSKALTDRSVCLPCNCQLAGITDDGDCAKAGLNTGQCNCKPHVTGLRCDQCSTTAYLNTTSGECHACNCNAQGSANLSCSAAGVCNCVPGFQGDRCDSCTATLALPGCDDCQAGFYNLSVDTGSSPLCEACQCSTLSSVDNSCDSSTGQCNCRAGFIGRDCTQCDPLAATHGPTCSVCIDGFYGFNGSHCAACSCHASGSSSSTCDKSNGQCTCQNGYTGRDCSVCHPSLGTGGSLCNMCLDGFHSFNGSHCEPCGCDGRGSTSNTCNSNGTCLCKEHVTGVKCELCKLNTLGLSADNPSGCAEVPAPSIGSFQSTQLTVSWSAPLSGTISSYTVFLDRPSGVPVRVTSATRPDSVPYSGLTPYTNYTFFVRACTATACAQSNSTTERTRSGAPAGQPAPVTLVRNGTTTIGWGTPSTTGGGPLLYTLRAAAVDFSEPPQRVVPGAAFEGLGFMEIQASTFAGSEASIMITFQTLLASATLFFATDIFVASRTAVQIVNGQAQFLFDFGSGAAAVISPSAAYNVSDGQPHTIVASRSGLVGMISVDGSFNATGQLNGVAGSVMPVATQVFVGGLPTQVSSLLPTLTPFITSPLSGCVGELSLQGVQVNLDQSATRRERVLPTMYGCPAVISHAMYFLGTAGGYVMDSENPLLHSGGTNFDIQLSFRTLRTDGLLLYSGEITSGKVADFFAVQIVNEEVSFVFDNGGGPVSVSTSLKAASISVCDGQWHTVIIYKNARVANISVDQGPFFSISAPDARLSTDVTAPVYLGGVPDSLLVPSQISSLRYYTGCLRSVRINSVQYTPDVAVFTRLTGCPMSSPTSQCLAYNAMFSTRRPAILYVGSDMQQTFPLSLLGPASEYSMQVSVSTETGSTSSSWNLLRASDGAPENLISPSISYTSGLSAIVTWSPPAVENGLLAGYRLLVTQMPTFDSSNALLLMPSTRTITVPGQTLSYLLDGLLASRDHAVQLESFTAGGSVSTGFVNFTTDEAAPLGVISPVAVADRRNISFTWQEPQDPSGQLTAYSLLIDGTAVFTSPNASQYSYTVTSLSPVTTYSAALQVCNSAGCSLSDAVDATTLEDAPEGQAVPALTAESETTISAMWPEPSQPNGVITAYNILLNATQIASIPGNATRRFIITGLRPATVYAVSIRANTKVGADLSSISTVSTLEHVPSGIEAAMLNVTSARSIHLEWTPPSIPNGVIVQYDVERDGIRQLLNLSAASLSYTDTALQPHTVYWYAIVACTRQGCSTGNASNARTAEDLPQGVQPAMLTTLNSSAVQIAWSQPSSPNGILTYSVYLHGAQLVSGMIVERFRPPITMAVSPLLINDLLPYQQYYCIVEASTSAGSANSTLSNIAQTEESAPDGVLPPVVDTVNSTYLVISWPEPRFPNGILVQYSLSLVRANTVDAPTVVTVPGTDLNTTVSTLMPFTLYQLQLTAFTSRGSTSSTTVLQRTAEDVPSGVPRPSITNVTSSSFMTSWSPPSLPNGIIIRYLIVTIGPEGTQSVTVDAAQTEVTLADGAGVSLEPATAYGVHLEACTAAGCGMSQQQSVQMAEAAPEGVQAPTVTFTNSSSIEFTWNVPSTTNGIITGYAVEIRTSAASQLVISLSFAGDLSPLRGILSTGLVPSTMYTLQLLASTAAGTGQSTLVTALTSDGTPTGVNPPQVSVVNSSAITISWQIPVTPNGKIHNYTVLRDGSQTVVVATAPGFIVDVSLEPFTDYTYKLVVCTAFACGSSAESQDTTAEAAPIGLAAPVAMALNTSYITITWAPPNITNGVIQAYRLLRYNANNCCTGSDLSSCQLDSILEGCVRSETTVVSSTLQLSTVDSDGNLEPYTLYAYRLLASTGGGSTSSSFGITQTPEDAPGGVTAPSVLSTSARAVTVQWTAPSQPNGIVVRYDVWRNGSAVTSRVSAGSVNDTGLLPATTYQYTVSVCTSAGCSEASTIITTLESAPEGVLAPSVTATSAMNISVAWLAPAQPNGLLVSYEVYINDESSPRVTLPSTTQATVLSSLQAFTSYRVSISACTAVGCTDSNHASVTTLEAIPAGMLSPALMVLTSRSIDVMWQSPTMENGIILGYTVHRNGTTIAAVNSTGRSFTDTGLLPHTLYSYTVSVGNSAGSVSSPANVATTDQDSPEGLIPPVVTAHNSSAFSITVSPPSQPNGVIVNYSVIVDNTRTVALGVTPSIVLAGFLPFSQHQFRSRACTHSGCGISVAVSSRTLEALASGILAPNISALNSSAIIMTWQPPQNANGIVTQYSIVRIAPGRHVNSTVYQQSAAPLISPLFIDNGLLPFSSYGYRLGVTNGAGTAFGPAMYEQTDEAAPLSAGLTMTAVPDKTSVFLQWTPPTTPNGILTYYRIDQRSQTSGNMSGVGAVPASQQTNFTVMGLRPYTDYEFRVTAVNDAGEASSPWQTIQTLQDIPQGVRPLQVAGKAVDGQSVNLTWDEPQFPNGMITDYMVHDGSGILEYQGTTRFFILRRLTAFTSYSLILSACTSVGCATSALQMVQTAEIAPVLQAPPTVQALSSSTMQLQWSPPAQANGIIISYSVSRKLSSATDSSAVQVLSVDAQNVTVLQYTDTGLEAYTAYSYQVTSANSADQVSSVFSSPVTTSPANPQGVPAPTVTTIDSFSIDLSWTSPTKPNGIISGYNVNRDGFPITTHMLSASTFNYVDSISLKPFTTHTYNIEACTVGASCTAGPSANGTTAQSQPDSVSLPSLSALSSSSIRVSWVPPLVPNGIISSYGVYYGECSKVLDSSMMVSGDQQQVTLTALSPYTCYSVLLEACTVAGCRNSTSVESETTLEAAPQGLTAARAIVLGQDRILLTINSPSQPNGMLVSYEVVRNGTSITFNNDTSNGALLPASYTDSSLSSGTAYAYTIVLSTNGGCSNSPVVVVQTFPPVPEGLDAPRISVVSSTALRITWSQPNNTYAPINRYSVFVNDTERHMNDGSSLTTLLSGLAAFSLYAVHISACTAFGCVSSDASLAYTLEATPTGLAAPTLTGVTSRILAVQWTNPSQPNGIIIGFYVERRQLDRLNLIPGMSTVIATTQRNDTSYADSNAMPFSTYEYRVTAYNTAGNVTSSWQRFTTAEDLPESVTIPVLREVEADRALLFLPQPEQSNGIITQYDVIVNGVPESTNYSSTTSLYELRDLTPGVFYTIKSSVCTSVGCTTSQASLNVTTPEIAPGDLDAPSVENISSTSFSAIWAPPAMPNGNILRYTLHVIRACPQPGSLPDSPCEVGDESTTVLTAEINYYQFVSLARFTRYLVRISATNSMGTVFSNYTDALTAESAPELRAPGNISYTTVEDSIMLQWTNSFIYNSDRFQQYTVIENGEVVTDGVIVNNRTTTLTLVGKMAGVVYLYTVSLRTAVGTVTTRPINASLPGEPVIEEVKGNEFYKEAPFIVGMVIAGLFLLMILVCIAHRPSSASSSSQKPSAHTALTDGPTSYSPNRERPSTPNRRRRNKKTDDHQDFWASNTVALQPPPNQDPATVRLVSKQPVHASDQEWDGGFTNLASSTSNLMRAPSKGSVHDGSLSGAQDGMGGSSNDLLRRANTYREYEGSTLKDTHL